MSAVKARKMLEAVNALALSNAPGHEHLSAVLISLTEYLNEICDERVVVLLEPEADYIDRMKDNL